MRVAARKKKLIEVALPLDVINAASAREKAIRHGHPSTLHLWWARRPLAAARAVIFAQLIDDPSEHLDLFPTERDQERERQRLFDIIRELVRWENTTNMAVLDKARAEIRKSWQITCGENSHDPNAAGLFDAENLPSFCDPFAGGGSLPLEAQRLGLSATASDLNPVAVLINKAMLEIPPLFSGMPPVNPEARGKKTLLSQEWNAAEGLASDLRYYGEWVRGEAEKRIGYLYPKIEVTSEMAAERPDLKAIVGSKLTMIARLFVRTVKSPNPAFANVDVPLASTFTLSTKPGKQAYVEPIIANGTYTFKVRGQGRQAREAARAAQGTKASGRGANFVCVMSGAPIPGDYIKAEGCAKRMDARLMAVVAESRHGRIYLAPTSDMDPEVLPSANAADFAKVDISGSTQYLGIKPYGMTTFCDLFTARQLKALTTFSDLIIDVKEQIERDAASAGLKANEPMKDDQTVARAYANAVATYLAFALDRSVDRGSTLCSWDSSPKMEALRNTFGRQALPMVWDYAEGNPFSNSSGNWMNNVEWCAKALACLPAEELGVATQADARSQPVPSGSVVSTDPPYYDNVPYADLSDFFYIWLRRTLAPIYPRLFATVAVPKADELVAFAHRHKDKLEAREFFMNGMRETMHRLAEDAHPAFPLTIYYAFKQSEDDGQDGRVSTGWETFLDAIIQAGFAINGTWPMRTELANRMRSMNANALASSIVLVCRRRAERAPIATKRDFISALKVELPSALIHLQHGNIAPVDLAQSAIGPGMAVFTRYAKVIDVEGRALAVRDALLIINQVLDEALTAQEGEFDSDTRWAIGWFEQFGFSEGNYGMAETLSKAKNTNIGGLVNAGIVSSKAGKVRLLRPAELDVTWNPDAGSRCTGWEIVHHLIRNLETGGEHAAALLLARLGSKGQLGRELAYRLYALCDRKKRPAEALSYNALVQSWAEIDRLAHEKSGIAETGRSQLSFEGISG